MGSLVGKIKRLVTIVLLVVAIVLVALAIIYWNAPSGDLSGSFLGAFDATKTLGALLTPGHALMLAGVLAFAAFAVDPETASRIVEAGKGLATSVGDFVTGSVTAIASPLIPWVIGGGLLLLFITNME